MASTELPLNMLDTQLKYYTDSTLLECQSTILQVIPHHSAQHTPGSIPEQNPEPNSTEKQPDSESTSRCFDLVLDATVFYPEGGGQPCDLGTIQGHRVVDVKKQHGVVIHRVVVDLATHLDPPFSPGTVVDCRVDPLHRRDYQQQHTGQHILSACLMSVGGHETVSIHQGEEYLMIETSKPVLDLHEIEEVQAMANRIIEEHVPITTEWVTDDQLDQYPLRRKPQVSGAIRLVIIGDYDCVACGGVHVEHTAQVRLIQYLGQETIRGRIRTMWKVGDRALADYGRKTQITQRLGKVFSASLDQLERAVEQKLEELNQVQKTYAQTLKDKASLIAQQIIQEHEGQRVSQEKPVVVVKMFEQEEKELVRQVALELSQAPQIIGLLFNLNLQPPDPISGTQEMVWTLTAGKETGFDFGLMRDQFFSLIHGKGGGKHPIWQGVGQTPRNIQDCVSLIQSTVDPLSG